MTVRTLRGALAVATTIVVGALVAGCASDAGSSPLDAKSGATPVEEMDAAWLDYGRMVGLVTLGSSSCLPTAVIGSYADGTLEVELFDDPEAACTRDLVPRVTLVPLPAEVDPTEDLEVQVSGEGYGGVALLPGLDNVDSADAGEFAPSAGWTGADGQFIVMTWGSSTCVPVVDTAEVTGEAEVTVTFLTPDADQVCTMDMAPRTNVVAVDVSGLGEGPVVASLTGGEFVGTVVPILGQR